MSGWEVGGEGLEDGEERKLNFESKRGIYKKNMVFYIGNCRLGVSKLRIMG